MPSEHPTLLTTDEVAHRLGVKPATLYSYVSRGLLTSRRNADGKGSLFAKPDVDAFIAGRKRTTTPTIQTGITLINEGNLYYRGRDACVLARTASFESVLTLLWTGDLQHEPLIPRRDALPLAVQAIGPLPTTARSTDILRVVVAMLSAVDPLRFDTSPAAVMATGRALLATAVAALPFEIGGPVTDARIAQENAEPTRLAEVLWHRLTAKVPYAADYEQLNTALVLLADHDIAASTLAARVAASTRAHPYAVVSAGLAALDGPLHGAASGLAYELLRTAVASKDPVGTIAERLRSGGTIAGFGHRLYPDGDPRAKTLLPLIDDGPVRVIAEAMAEVMRERSGIHPNIDFALATLALTHEMPADAGEAIFAVARTAGWIGHALEEYADRPLRFRPDGQYSGRPPAT